MSLSIVFFEIRSGSMLRFPLWLAQSISELGADIDYKFLSNYGVTAADESVLRNKLTRVEVIGSNMRSFSIRSVRKVLSEEQPSLVVVFAHRLPDIIVLHAARQLGIKTLYYQHGLYIPFMKRVPTLFFTNIIKTLRYLKYSANLSLLSRSPLRDLMTFIQIFVTGTKSIATSNQAARALADLCLVYGEHWQHYHCDEYGYDIDQTIVVGAPDLSGINLLNDEQIIPAGNGLLCYVAQTLYEDGRIERHVMRNFIEALGAAAIQANAKLVVKLHPRSDVSLYEGVCGVSGLETVFPSAEVYIGHYSSMLIRGIMHSSKFLIVELPGHEPPQYFKILSESWVKDGALSVDVLHHRIHDLLRGVHEHKHWALQKRRLDQYFSGNGESAFVRAAKVIAGALS